jgi:hypothetical protein
MYFWPCCRPRYATQYQFPQPDPLGCFFKFEFFKPWYCTNTTDFSFRSTASGTEVTWAMFMKNNFLAKASSLVMNLDKMMGESFEAGLVKLKEIAEAAAKK